MECLIPRFCTVNITTVKSIGSKQDNFGGYFNFISFSELFLDAYRTLEKFNGYISIMQITELDCVSVTCIYISIHDLTQNLYIMHECSTEQFYRANSV